MKISIITVTYNSSKTIADTITSVYNQSYQNIEHIIVDGNSKDDTLKIVKNLPNRVEKIISEPDKGIYDAMNKGIKIATGDIVGILNSDDFYHKNDIIELIAKAFENKNVESVYGDVRFVSQDNLDKTVRYYSSKIFKPYLFKFGFMPAHPTFFIYKRFFDEYGYYKMGYKIAADFELLLRFIKNNNLKTLYISTDFLKMRVGGVSTKSIKSNFILNKEIIRACKENGIRTNYLYLSFKYFIKVFGLIRVRN